MARTPSFTDPDASVATTRKAGPQKSAPLKSARRRSFSGEYGRCFAPPTSPQEQNQKKRTIHPLPKFDNFIRYRHHSKPSAGSRQPMRRLSRARPRRSDRNRKLGALALNETVALRDETTRNSRGGLRRRCHSNRGPLRVANRRNRDWGKFSPRGDMLPRAIIRYGLVIALRAYLQGGAGDFLSAPNQLSREMNSDRSTIRVRPTER
jgi:hypothetical protein